jgi:uncharacterized glyoxalase superfamily protein PhnB
MRVTTGMRRIGGEWRVLHEHVSIPFQMEGQAECGAGEAASQPAPEFSAAAKAASHGVHRLSPYLICAGAAKAIDFYKEAFGAEELMRLEIEPGRIMHACLKINGSSVMLGEENAEMGAKSPTTLKATPVTMHLIVDDADRFAARAVEAGAKIVMPVADMFWGDRYGIVEDPFGHRWAVATPKKPIFGKELEEAAKAAVAAHKRARASQQAQA